MGMYRTIDDADDAGLEDGVPEGAAEADGPERGSARWVVASMAVAFATLAFLTVLSLPSGGSGPGPAVETDEARSAYLAALSESSPALRRARLRDFATTYPDSDRADAVRAQLSILDAHEGSAWARVTDSLYDRRASRADKLAALDTYESVWGPNLLGGRAEDIRERREELMALADEEATPSRQLDEEPSPIPESINAGAMAGGPSIYLPPATLPPLPAPPPAPVTRSVETPPRVVSSPKPRYPSSAMRRGVEATVTIAMDIDERGRVEDARVVSVDARRYGKEFARAARRAAKRTRFDPRRIDGEAVPTLNVTKRYRFQL